MKRFCKFLGIIAITTLIGFAMTACDSSDDGGGVIDTSGRLTITGIPSQFNGKYAFAEGEDYNSYLIGGESVDRGGESGRAAQISNGRVTLKIWSMNENSGNLGSYNGSGYATFAVFIMNSAQVNESTMNNESNFVGMGSVDATFSNGIGTGEFEDYGGWY